MHKVTPKKAKCLALLGTASEVGKSIVVTAMCRILARKGFRVAPYKAQNMSNNSGVTPEGLEMGRAQIVQAEAAGIPPHINMNPILLKPTSEVGAQVVLMGEARENLSARAYHEKKSMLWTTACQALDRLRSDFDVVVLEGAGSCAEVNLMQHDIVNFKMAEYADAPVVLVADIHRGGVFAQVVGTLECLNPSERSRVAGFMINRFRGDISLFNDGIQWIGDKTGKISYGVIPWYHDITIEAEDSVVIENPKSVDQLRKDRTAIAVIRLPHISNFTDFQPLSNLEGIDVYFLEKVQSLNDFNAVILPGSKNTRFDLNWINKSGWKEALLAYRQAGGHILGICGGYQMMGTRVHDLNGMEGISGSSRGLGLLPVETFLKSPKTTTRTRFSWQDASGLGYEIHMGHTFRKEGTPWFEIHARNHDTCEDHEGCIQDDGRTRGTYIHGLFDTPGILKKWLETIGIQDMKFPETGGLAFREQEYDRLADHFETYLDVERIMGTLGIK